MKHQIGFRTSLWSAAVLAAGVGGFLSGARVDRLFSHPATVLAQSGAERPERQRVCAVGLLQGPYVFNAEGVINGSTPPVNSPGPYTTVGVINFDGRGNLMLNNTQSYNGLIVGPTNIVGVYGLGEDCQGRVTLNTGAVFNIVASDNGRDVSLIQINNGSVIHGSAKKLH